MKLEDKFFNTINNEILNLNTYQNYLKKHINSYLITIFISLLALSSSFVFFVFFKDSHITLYEKSVIFVFSLLGIFGSSYFLSNSILLIFEYILISNCKKKNNFYSAFEKEADGEVIKNILTNVSLDIKSFAKYKVILNEIKDLIGENNLNHYLKTTRMKTSLDVCNLYFLYSFFYEIKEVLKDPSINEEAEIFIEKQVKKLLN